MRELFCDTETSGFVSSQPLDHESQPHLVQLAMIQRENGKAVNQCSHVVRCPVPIPDKAQAVHGYDQGRTQAIGITPRAACEMFVQLASNSDIVIAHNAKFDRDIMKIAIARTGVTRPWCLDDDLAGLHGWLCTMKEAEPYCRIPATEKQIRAGFKKRGDFKQPKLDEALRLLTGEEIENAHDALADVQACMKIYDWLVSDDRSDQGSAA